MDISGGILDFVQRFRNLEVQTDSKDQLIKDLLVYSEGIETILRAQNQGLLIELRDAKLDLDDATKSRRDLQQQLQEVETRNMLISQDNSHLKNNNPYVIVLIDGEGLLFKQAFIKQGVEGGKRAAYALRTAILTECGEHASDVEVVAKVYANLAGLSKAMRRDGSLENESDLKDFSLGFTQGKATFDFVDVGHGKERADNKIKESTKWNLRNFNCKQAILGISHDAGYAPFLDELFHDDAARRRVTVLEGFPTVRELIATGANILNLNDDLFRSDKLVDKVPTSLSLPSAGGGGGVGANGLGNAANGVVGPGTILTPAASATSTPSTAPATTWARAISNASPPPQITLPLQPRPVNTPARAAAQQAKPAPWNPGPRGVDSPITVVQSALDNIKKRKDNNKLCNNHYLRGPCVKGDACCFEHRYKPTKDEIVAIAFLARLNPCTSGQECEVKDCIYGHHCPSVRDGMCTHPYCKFGTADHPPGTKFRTKSHDY
ncbi:hypothetical protein B0T26DRAFT_657086 [Lasiosphaeria miniovina]|uniref:C3H1-type domain-containing protein n=1 Tax=Lasiosphaeria miniovina TaxID=1954250 RepID=A0AA40DMI4_9PEZI|nr:uncharacterized protein B0T26DRAFT_657086 [Lasiosphaeria miniovina]KAK0706716.1 hypothetical protein B0T26DRAFT_657086 [Lasiosphaeria miniovina]